jgi:hypothetical protein
MSLAASPYPRNSATRDAVDPPEGYRYVKA